MTKDAISEYDTTAANNTDVGGVDLAENSMVPADVNNAFREIMSHLKDVDSGASALSAPDINGGTIDGTVIGGASAAAGTFTTLGFTGASLTASNAAGPALMNEAATSTNPTLVPNRADPDTGVGWVSANIGSLVAGGSETLRWSSTSVLPGTDGNDFGSASLRWDMFANYFQADGNAVIGTNAGNVLTVNSTLKVGTHSAIGAETVTGYIAIQDISGTVRKVAIVS